MTESFMTFSARHRWLALFIVFVLSAVAVGGVLKLEIDTSYESLINENDPGKIDYNKTIDIFGSDNTTIVYVRDANLFHPDKLAALEDFVYQVQDVEGVEAVDSLFSVVSIRDVNGSLDARPLMEVPPENKEEADKIKADAIYSPLIRNNLLSDDGTVTAVNITVRRDASDARFNHRIYRAIEALIKPIRSNFESILQVGPPRLNVEIESGMFSDLSILTPISTLVLIISIIIVMKLPFSAILPMVTSGTSILWTLGFMGYIGLKLTLLTAIVPSLIIVIGSTEDMHLVAAYLEGLTKEKIKNRFPAIQVMARHVGVAVFLTGFTTALGFFSNMINDIPLIRDFAYASGFGMIANLFVTLLMVPLMLSMFGPRHNPLHSDGNAVPSGFVGKMVGLFEYLLEHHYRLVIVATVATVVVFSALATRVHVSNDPLSYFPPDHPLVRDADRLHKDLSGMQIFYVTLDANRKGAFREPASLLELEKVSKFLNQQGVYDKTISLSDHLSLVNRELHDADPAYFKVPDNKDTIAQYLMLFQRSDLERYVSPDYSAVNIVVRHNVSDSHFLNKHLDDLEAYLNKSLGEGLSYRLTGENLMINKAAEGLFMGQVQSLLLIGVVIFIMMSIMYTSAFAGLMFLIPNFIPLVMNFGGMALLGIPLNPGTASVAAIALGIAVDDSIHLFSRYREEVRRGSEPEDAVRATVRGEAVAVVTTSVSLMAMYITLLASNFAIVAQFGLLAALTMVYALISDLLITPMVLKHVGLVSLHEIMGLKVAREVIAHSPLFKGMSNYQVKKVILLSKCLSFEAGNDIIRQGTSGDSMFLVLKGEVDVCHDSGKGEALIASLGPGQVFGEVGFVGTTERTATVRARNKVEVLVLEAGAVAKTLRFRPVIASKLNLNISKVMGERLASAAKHWK